RAGGRARPWSRAVAEIVGLEQRVEGRREPERSRIAAVIDRRRAARQLEVVVSGVRQTVGAVHVGVYGRRILAAGARADAEPFGAARREVAAVARVQRGAADLTEPVAADQVVQEVDAGGIRRRRGLTDDARTSARRTGGRAVAGDGVVDEVRLVIPRDVHAAPRVGVN